MLTLALAEDQIFSGPQTGEKLGDLNVRLAYGDVRGRQVDFVQMAQGRPIVLVLVHGANRPAARLTRAVLNYCEMYKEELFAALVYLDDDLNGAEKYLQRAVSWWGVGTPVGISIDGAEGPGHLGLNRHVNVTVLVANKERVVANFALVQPSLTDVSRILSAVGKLIGRGPPTERAVSFLSAPTNGPRNVAWRKAPQDPRLRQLICDTLAAADQQQASAAARAAEQYAGENAQRQRALGQAAALLLPTRRGATYGPSARGSPAEKYVRQWLDKYGE